MFFHQLVEVPQRALNKLPINSLDIRAVFYSSVKSTVISEERALDSARFQLGY